MSSPPDRPATCVCGKVDFDVARCSPGETLTCPWCWAQYRYTGQGRMHPLGTSTTHSEAQTHRPDHHTANSLDEPPNSEKVRTEVPLAATRKPQESLKAKHLPSDHPPKHVILKTPPGGIWPMLICIVVFNSIAFAASSCIFANQPDGTRGKIIGYVVSTSSVLPEILALLAGHMVGFCVWVLYLYYMFTRMKTRKPAEKEPGTAGKPSN